jgi:hypothetical protein
MHMNKKLVFSLLLLSILCFAAVGQTLGATRLPGVNEQDHFIYSIYSLWNPNNPNAAAPADLVAFNNTNYYNVTIASVSGSNVSSENIWVYKVGGQNQSFVVQNVDSGSLFVMKGLVDIVGANLGVNDFVYNSGDDPRRINETVHMDYGGVIRDTNAVYVSYPITDSSGNSSGYGYSAYYFDRQTGVLVARSDNTVDSTGNVTITMLLSGTNRWTVSALPRVVSNSNPGSDSVQLFGVTMPTYVVGAIVAVIILLVAGILIVFLRRRKSHRKRHRR